MPGLTIEKFNDVINGFELKEDKFSTFIESGTYTGTTVLALQPHFDVCHTIEISETLYENFMKDLLYAQYKNTLKNVTGHLGDSSKIIPELLTEFDEDTKCVFWLDGHFSSGVTSRGEKDVPLLEECKAIDTLYKADKGLVLIDDLRLFGTSHAEDWENITVDNVLECFSNFNVVYFEHPDDMLCIYISKE